MQLDGIGGGHSSTHRVTNCIHDHAHFDKTGKMGAAAASGADVRSMMTAESQADAQFSLAAWLDRALSGGKKLWGNIWGSGEGAGTAGTEGVPAAGTEGVSGSGSGAERVVLAFEQERDNARSTAQGLHAGQIAAAAVTVSPPQDIHNNPYFSAVDRSDERQGNLWRRMKVKFKDMAGQLAGHLPGKFFSAQTKNSFQTRQDRPKEDLRRHSKFRRDELEIDCVLTDDSYLLDSYDRKGAYSKLSAGR